jgi:mRNA interferase HicA
MKDAELRRWLARQGCTFEERTKHTIVRLGKRQSLLPRHPGKDVKTGTYKAILKDLGLNK